MTHIEMNMSENEISKMKKGKAIISGTIPQNNRLFSGTVLPNNTLFGGTVPTNSTLFSN